MLSRGTVTLSILLIIATIAMPVMAQDMTAPQVDPVDDTEPSGVETVPPETKPVDYQVTNWLLLLLVVMIVSGAMATYMPGEVRRMRILSAQREYMDARLALAQGDYPSALVGFDSAIEEAQRAYTRRDSISGPAEWVLMPDDFYINLWRGRAMALRGVGRERVAKATLEMADELQASVTSGNGHR